MSELKGAAKRIFGGLQNRLSRLARFGQSKHEAKQAAREAYIKEHGYLEGYYPARVDGIFSLSTMKTYRAVMQPFAKWLAAHKVKNASQITKEHAAAYLREREATGLSAWTVSREMSAINKALGFDLTKQELGLRQRKKSEITRSREETENDRRRFTKFQDQITVAKACGCRRASITRITPNDCVRNEKGQVVGIRVVEKGGRERVAPVLNEYKEQVTAPGHRHRRPVAGGRPAVLSGIRQPHRQPPLPGRVLRRSAPSTGTGRSTGEALVRRRSQSSELHPSQREGQTLRRHLPGPPHSGGGCRQRGHGPQPPGDHVFPLQLHRLTVP